MRKPKWVRYQRIVGNHLDKQYWPRKVEREFCHTTKKRTSCPDFIVRHFIFSDHIAEAKSGSRISNYDIDKLIDDMNVHDVVWAELYISTESEISENILDYAQQNNIKVKRLGWNGQLIEEF